MPKHCWKCGVELHGVSSECDSCEQGLKFEKATSLPVTYKVDVSRIKTLEDAILILQLVATNLCVSTDHQLFSKLKHLLKT